MFYGFHRVLILSSMLLTFFNSQYVLHMCYNIQTETYGKGLRPCPKEISV